MLGGNCEGSPACAMNLTLCPATRQDVRLVVGYDPSYEPEFGIRFPMPKAPEPVTVSRDFKTEALRPLRHLMPRRQYRRPESRIRES